MNFVLDKMFQNYRTLVLTLIIFAVFENSSTGAGNLLGSAAPHFRVQSGEDKELTSEVIKGKVTAIFYENKDIVYANKPIKDELNKLYSEQPAAVKKPIDQAPDH